jgi:hypothetical protein
MSDLTISAAASLDHTTLAAGDLFPVCHISASVGSKGSNITLTELSLAVHNGVTISGGAYTFTIPATGTAALLGTAQTFTAANVFSVNGAASTPALSVTGTVFTSGTATSTKPLFLAEPAGTTSNAWSTAGTIIGGNASSGFSGMLIDMQKAASSKFSVRNDGYTVSAFGFGANSIYNGSGGLVLSLGAYAALTVPLRISNVAVTGLGAGVLAATTNATIVIQDSTGQAYRIPCII